MSPHEPTGVSRSVLGQGPTEASLSPDIAEWSIVATKAENGVSNEDDYMITSAYKPGDVDRRCSKWQRER